MSPPEGLVKELDEKYVNLIVKFVADIRSGKLEGSNNIAVATVTFLEQIISDSQNASAFELSNVIREIGRRLVRALPHQLVAANMVRRVLRAIRDEHRAHVDQSGEGAGESLQRLVLATPSRRSTLGPAEQDLREPLRDHIAEILAELESSTSSICSQARSHVHADELVLTYGASRLAEKFLRAAAARRYRLIVAEGVDVQRSHAMASRLAAAGVAVTVVSSASVCGLMPRVNKVIVCAGAALAGGAVLAAGGLHALTTAAKYYSVPVLVLAPLYKLSPLHAYDQQHLNALASPAQALPYQRAESSAVNVFAPLYDFVPPDHVTLFITSLGGSSPTYVYRLLSELYDPKDHQM